MQQNRKKPLKKYKIKQKYAIKLEKRKYSALMKQMQFYLLSFL